MAPSALLAALLVTAPQQAAAAASPTWQVTGEQVWNGSSFAPRTVWIVDGTFTDTHPGRVDSVLDVGGRYLLPPFAEAHTHTLAYVPAREAEFLRLGILYALVLNVHASQWATNRAWFTDPGSVEVNASLAGFTAPDGHPVQIGLRGVQSVGDLDGDWITAVDTPEELDRKWPATAALNDDVVKAFLLYSDRWAERRGDPGIPPRYRGMNPAVLPPLVEKAHAAGLRVAAHVRTAHDFRVAVDAGVDLIAHLPGFSMGPGSEGEAADPERRAEIDDPERFVIDPAVARRAAEGGITVITTLGSLGRVPPGAPAQLRAAMERAFRVRRDVIVRNLRTLSEAGVGIAVGSDAGEGNSVEELLVLDRLRVHDRAALLERMVGATPRLIFPRRSIGRIAEGHEASFVVLGRDPLADLEAVRDVQMLFQRGRRVPLP